MTTLYFVNDKGEYIGGFVDAMPPAGAIEVPVPPSDAADVWSFQLQKFISSADPIRRHITKFAFRRRFSMGEKVAIDLASIDDSTAAAPAREQQAIIRVLLKEVDTAEFIDLDLGETRAGALQLENYGLLAAGRALEILDAPINPDEVFF